MQKEKLKNLLKNGKFLDFLTVLSFVASYILIVLISTDWGKYIFGSETDFSNQHYQSYIVVLMNFAFLCID